MYEINVNFGTGRQIAYVVCGTTSSSGPPPTYVRWTPLSSFPPAATAGHPLARDEERQTCTTSTPSNRGGQF
jgi:hypothetical protein